MANDVGLSVQVWTFASCTCRTLPPACVRTRSTFRHDVARARPPRRHRSARAGDPSALAQRRASPCRRLYRAGAAMVDDVTRHCVQRLANRVTFELSGTQAASVVLKLSSFHSLKLAFAALQRYGDARLGCAAGMHGSRGGREGGVRVDVLALTHKNLHSAKEWNNKR